MKLINKKRFNFQFNKYFLEGPLILFFLFSILFEIIGFWFLSYDISEPYKGIKINVFLIFLYFSLPRSYDTENFKKELSYFISLNYSRKEYFKNKTILINLAISTSVLFSTILIFMLLTSTGRYNVFGYLGFVMGKNFISFFKISFINIIIYNLFYTFILIVKVLFIKVIPNRVGNFIFNVVWSIVFLLFWRGLNDIYINIPVPNITLICSILFILIAYYVYYKFIMSLDV
ncbi:hypothetical protein KQI86_02815 [Clostridium sp. MSJ-11]|uniref:ABC-2 family transporter protein n=1 Tax=Clostridium mobile TaxID=2841512 RepID=A0ABS6EDG9_9CLOT|nr:hypothetical protein [Clostridium mobile]MBU5483243.1 hypothetical protein [Clostridium mobile]